MKRKLILSVLILNLLGLHYVVAETRPLSEAQQTIVKKAQQGNVNAQLYLALMYGSGLGIDSDSDQVLKWNKLAAEQGSAEAMYNLGKIYQRQEDYTMALKYLSEAANKQYSNAQYRLGQMYQTGKGVAQNYDEAFKWYLLAANNNDSMARVRLGDMYYYGLGVKQDDTEALLWYQRATFSDVGEFAPNATALYTLGRMYEQGEGIEQNYEIATSFYKLAAELLAFPYSDFEAILAKNRLATIYYYGLMGQPDYKETLNAIKLGSYKTPYDNFLLARMYVNGEGVKQDTKKAFELYKKSHLNQAYYFMGVMYENGQGVTQDYDKALKDYMEAAEGGDALAQYSIGALYAKGLGVKKSSDEAKKWYRIACDNGNQEGCDQYNASN